MAEEIKSVDADAGAVDAVTLQKQLDELKAKVNAADTAKAEADALAKQLIDERDKAKGEKRALEQKQLEEQGQFKELFEKALIDQKALEAELTELRPIKSQYEETQAKLQETIDRERTALLAQVPEEQREQSKDLPLDALRIIVSVATGKQPGTFTGASTHQAAKGHEKWSEMTGTERIEKARALPQDQLNELMKT